MPAAVALLVLLLGSASPAILPSGIAYAPLSPHGPASAHPAPLPPGTAALARPWPALVRPADATDNYTCFKINATVCVSAVNGSVNVVPSIGNVTSSVHPNANQSLSFYIKSKYSLTWTNAPTACNNITPIRINVTGVLWNGVPFMSQYDGTMWNNNVGTPCWSSVGSVTNKSYQFWYTVTIRNASSGGPQFFPGEYVTWWIYLVHKWPAGNFSHVLSPQFHYLIAGAWAFSPYQGAAQYGGANAAILDLNVLRTPVLPNWNDPTKVTIATTPVDGETNCTIGAAWVDVRATLPNGLPLPNATYNFPLDVPAGYGANRATITVPPSYSQVAGTVVNLVITAFDANNPARYARDMIVSPTYTYTVGGNGTFIADNFANDILVTTSPLALATGLIPGPVVAPGTNVTILLTSKNPGTALLAAQVNYIFQFPPLHEQLRGSASFSRINSTNLFLQMPGIPAGAYMNFTILVWDYAATLDISSPFGYSVLTFSDIIPSVPPNLGFFWIFVYDNGSASWVDGALVTVDGSGGFIDVRTSTSFGIALPNATGLPFSPLLLPVNTTYNITVTDPTFIPAGQRNPVTVSVSFTLRNPMNASETLLQSSSATVVLSHLPDDIQGELFFWLNTSAPGPTFSPAPPVQGSLIGPVVGLVAAVAAFVPLLWWWSEIARRRKEQEKRVTL